MSFFKNVMASIGIGSAKVDTIIDTSTGQFRVGDEVSGKVVITGGNTAQQINEIYLYLMTSYIKEVNDSKVRENGTIGKLALNESFTIQANTTKEIPFSLVIPYITPISLGRTQIWIKTGLDIESALDASDNDYIKILPHPIVAQILDSLALLGFRIHEIDCKHEPRSKMGFNFVQEFELKPGRDFRGLDELEVVFCPYEDYVEVFMEIDRKARGLFSMLDMDETRIKFQINKDDVRQGQQALAEHLSSMIRRYM